MDIKKLKEMNKVAIAVEGRYEVLKIQRAVSEGNVNENELQIAKEMQERYTRELDEQEENFNVNYEDVRDIVFKDMKAKNIQAVGFARRIGEDEHTAYYAVGLYDLPKAKSKNLTDLQAVEKGYGVVIAIMPQTLNQPQFLMESRFYDDIINVLNNKEKFGVKPLAIKSYHNFKDENAFEYDEKLWNLVEETMAEKAEIKEEVKEEEKKYVPTLYAIKPAIPRPYSQIGHYNEAKEYNK